MKPTYFTSEFDTHFLSDGQNFDFKNKPGNRNKPIEISLSFKSKVGKRLNIWKGWKLWNVI